MVRNILAVVAALATWTIFVVVGGLCLRAWPAYEAAAPSMSFDFSMMIARLALSSVALVAAGWVAQRVSRPWPYAALGFGVVMLLAFIPIHINLWPKFPLWYHLYFLASLIVLPQATAMAASRPKGPSIAAAG